MRLLIKIQHKSMLQGKNMHGAEFTDYTVAFQEAMRYNKTGVKLYRSRFYR